MENGYSLNPSGVIECIDFTFSMLPDSASIVLFEARNIVFKNARIRLSHSPDVIIENCTYGSTSSLTVGEFTEESKTDPEKPRKSTSFHMKNIYQFHPNLIMISQYDSIYLSGFTFDRLHFPYTECLFANSRNLVWENSEARFLLYIELVDDILFQNTTILDNAFISITQSRNIIMNNIGSDRDATQIPYPLFLISFSVYVTISNSSLSIATPFLYSSSLMTISLDNLTFHDSSIEGSLITATSVKTLNVNNCYFLNINGNCLNIRDIFDFEIKKSKFTNITSNSIDGAIKYSDPPTSSIKPFSGIQHHSILDVDFENCQGGALVFSFSDIKLNVKNCYFFNNSAPKGGAIYFQQEFVKSFLTVTHSKFIANGGPKTDGGAVFIVGGATFSDTLFENNVAERGGVVFVGEGANFATVSFDNNFQFINNTATLGPIGYTESVSPRSLYKYFNGSMSLFTSEEVSSPCFKFDFQLTDATSGKRIDENKVISPFLGQTLIIEIDPKDIFGKKIKEPTGILSISVDNSKYLLRTGPRNEDGTRLEFTIFSHERVMTLENVTLLFKYERGQAKVRAEIADCPSLYIFDAAGCVNIWYWIPIASVLSSFIVGISLIAIIFIFFARYKSQLLKRRKRADKEMEQVLLDKRIIFENEESPKQTSNTFIISTDDIKIIKKIGEGGQGTVYQAKWNNKDVAIKSIKKEGMDDNDEFEKEATLLMSLSHPNIVNLFGFCVPNPNQKYMVIEYMKGGSLDKLITECKLGKKSLSLKEKLNILVEVSRGMNYLHTLKPNIISHRDLKPQNILLDEHRSVRICDFGLSRLVGANTLQTSMTLNIGTLLYCPPENFVDNRPSFDFIGNMSGFSYESFAGSLQSEASISSSFSRDDRYKIASKFDVYSFGIIMWSLFFEEDPYTVYNHKKMNFFIDSEEGSAFNVITQIVKGRRPTIPFTNDVQLEHWSREFLQPNEKRVLDEFSIQGIINYMNLMQKCWHQIPQERPNFEAVLCDLYEIMHLCGGSMLV